MAFVVLFALLAAVTNSIFGLANRFVVARGGLREFPASMLVQVLTGLVAGAVILVLRVPWTPGAWGPMLTVMVIALAGFVLMMFAFAREDASVVGPILGTKVLWLSVLESITQGHPAGMGVYLGAVISMAGVALVTQKDRWSLHPRDLLRPGVLMMLGAASCYAVCDIFVKQTLRVWDGNSLGVALYLVVMSAALSALLMLCIPALRPTLPRASDAVPGRVPPSRVLAIAAPISAVANFLMQYWLFTAFAYSGTVTLPNILYNTRNLFVVLFAATLVLGARSDIEHAGLRAYTFRIAGAILTIASIAVVLLVR